MKRANLGVLLPLSTALAGCWTPPSADVQPKGEPRLIQGSIRVESIKDPAIVQSVDPGTRVIVVQHPGATGTSEYRASTRVSGLGRIKPGDKVQATVAEELTVYVLRDGALPGPGGSREPIATEARVLKVDRSYRLLSLQYRNGRQETFKVALGVWLGEMEPGDDVAIRVLEAVDLRVL